MKALLEQKDAPDSNHEQLRLRALDRYDLLDTSGEEELDGLTELAALVCGTPIAVISLVASDRQWFKSKVGLTITQTPLSSSFCQHALHGAGLLEVRDARQDVRFLENPLVIGSPNLRFYAGVPLMTPQGHVLGTLCVIDTEPRILTQDQRMGLTVLARQVMTHFELRRNRLARLAERQQLAQVHEKLEALQDQVKKTFQTPLEQAMRVLDSSGSKGVPSAKGKAGIKALVNATSEVERQIGGLLAMDLFAK